MKKMREAYQIEFTPKELWYKLFKKKICPVCANKMESIKMKSYQGVGKVGTAGHRYKAEIYQYKQYYKCKMCNKLYSISELSNIERKNYI